jgi:hypothetical protein
MKSCLGEGEKINLLYTQGYIKESMNDYEEIMDAEFNEF